MWLLDVAPCYSFLIVCHSFNPLTTTRVETIGHHKSPEGQQLQNALHLDSPKNASSKNSSYVIPQSNSIYDYS